MNIINKPVKPVAGNSKMKICLVLSIHSILLGKEHENKSISALGLRTAEVSFAAFSQTYTDTDIQIKK